MKRNKKAEIVEEAEVLAKAPQPAVAPKAPAPRSAALDDDYTETITKSDAGNFPKLAKQNQQPAAEKVDESSFSVETAVLKPVAGGLQPIIAPKGEVQLAPVVVPVAFVPYATQNQPLLQIDKKAPKAAAPTAAPQQQQQPQLQEIKDQPLDKKAARAAKHGDVSPMIVGEEVVEESAAVATKKSKTKARVFASVLFIFTLLFFVPIILHYFLPTLGGVGDKILGTGDPDIIEAWIGFDRTDIVGQIPLFIFSVACLLGVLNLILSFVTICNGKGMHLWVISVLMLILTLVGTLLCAFNVFNTMTIGLNPIGDDAFAWRLILLALILTVLSLCFIPRKAKVVEDDIIQIK